MSTEREAQRKEITGKNQRLPRLTIHVGDYSNLVICDSLEEELYTLVTLLDYRLKLGRFLSSP